MLIRQYTADLQGVNSQQNGEMENCEEKVF